MVSQWFYLTIYSTVVLYSILIAVFVMSVESFVALNAFFCISTHFPSKGIVVCYVLTWNWPAQNQMKKPKWINKKNPWIHTHHSTNCLLHFKSLEIPLAERKSRLQDFPRRTKKNTNFWMVLQFFCFSIFFSLLLLSKTHFITEPFLCSGWLGYQDKST